MKGTGVTPLWAAVNTQWQPRTRFPQPQNIELQKHTYLEVMEALLKAGADAERAHRSRIRGSWSTPAAATATAVSRIRPGRRRSGARPTPSTSTR